MIKVFNHLLAVFVVVITFGVYNAILVGICEALGWEAERTASIITGLLLANSLKWLEKTNEELEK